MADRLIWFTFLGICLAVLDVISAQSTVEGFAGGAATLPCTVSIQGDLQWKQGANLILIKPVNGSPTPSESAWKDVVSLVDSTNNMRISSLELGKDNNITFTCKGTLAPDTQTTRVRVLVRITAARIDQADQGQVTLQESVPKTLTCTVTGNPNPRPSYSWAVDTVQVSTQGSSYSLTANRSMKTVKCTATNLYSNGSVLSGVVAEAGLNVQYLDKPSNPSSVTVIENDRVSLLCSAEGNPPPTFEWRRSESVDVKSSSAEYTIENVQRSDAGQYICTVTNTVGGREATPTTVTVQYSPDLTLKWDSGRRVITCEASGVPSSYYFDPWIHTYGRITVRTLPVNMSAATNKNTLHFSRMSVEDTGNYVCSVSNGIGGTQKRPYHLKPNTGTIFAQGKVDYEIEAGRTLDIPVMFYSYPASSAVEWRRTKSSDLIKSHKENVSLVSLLFYGKPVIIQGTVTVLSLSHVSPPAVENYTVTVANAVNGEVVTSELTVTTRAVLKYPGNTGSNTGAIVGAIVGILVVIVGVLLAVVFYRRHVQRKDSPPTTDIRQQTYDRENGRVVGTVPRETDDTSRDPVTEQVNNYERLSSTIGQDRAYDDLSVSAITRDDAYENTGPVTSMRSGHHQTGQNYENVNLQP